MLLLRPCTLWCRPCLCGRSLQMALLLITTAVLSAWEDTAGGTPLLIGDYALSQSSYANTLSGESALGSSLVAVSTGGSFGFVTSGENPGWSWSNATSPGTGLSLSGLPANDGTGFGSYSIGMRFSLGQVSGWRKLIDFKPEEVGMYVVDGRFKFYDDGTNPTAGTIAANTPVDFILTRNTSGMLEAFLNGSTTPIFSSALGSEAKTDVSRTLRFFVDRPGFGDNEFSSSGSISRLRVWNGPLTAAEIPNAMVVVPEPATGILLVIIEALYIGLQCLRHRQPRAAIVWRNRPLPRPHAQSPSPPPPLRRPAYF